MPLVLGEAVPWRWLLAECVLSMHKVPGSTSVSGQTNQQEGVLMYDFSAYRSNFLSFAEKGYLYFPDAFP